VVPEWFVGVILFALGLFTAFQAWVGIVLVGLVRDLAVYRERLEQHEERSKERYDSLAKRVDSLETLAHGRS